MRSVVKRRAYHVGYLMRLFEGGRDEEAERRETTQLGEKKEAAGSLARSLQSRRGERAPKRQDRQEAATRILPSSKISDFSLSSLIRTHIS